MTSIPRDLDYLAIVVAALASEVGLHPDLIEASQELSAIEGIESLNILRAVVQIEEECGIAVPDDFLFETATVRELAELVSELAGRRR